MAAKKRSKDNSQRTLGVAAALAVVFVIVVYGGQLTGMPVYNGTLTVTVTDVLTCQPYLNNGAWTTGTNGENAMGITASAGQTVADTSADIKVSNTGNTVMDVNLTVTTDSNSYFTQSHLTLNGITYNTAAAKVEIWNNVAAQTQTGASPFTAVVHATEAAGAYPLIFNLNCDFTVQ